MLKCGVSVFCNSNGLGERFGFIKEWVVTGIERWTMEWTAPDYSDCYRCDFWEDDDHGDNTVDGAGDGGGGHDDDTNDDDDDHDHDHYHDHDEYHSWYYCH